MNIRHLTQLCKFCSCDETDLLATLRYATRCRYSGHRAVPQHVTVTAAVGRPGSWTAPGPSGNLRAQGQAALGSRMHALHGEDREDFCSVMAHPGAGWLPAVVPHPCHLGWGRGKIISVICCFSVSSRAKSGSGQAPKTASPLYCSKHTQCPHDNALELHTGTGGQGPALEVLTVHRGQRAPRRVRGCTGRGGDRQGSWKAVQGRCPEVMTPQGSGSAEQEKGNHWGSPGGGDPRVGQRGVGLSRGPGQVRILAVVGRSPVHGSDTRKWETGVQNPGEGCGHDGGGATLLPPSAFRELADLPASLPPAGQTPPLSPSLGLN